jgi:methyl-accepting chemotaxis protein
MSRLSARLPAVFIGFGLVPALLILGLLWLNTQALHQETMRSIEQKAVHISDVIDRNLFERYGDVQAFAGNPLARDPAAWQDQRRADLIAAMNDYVRLYGIYQITMILDRGGMVQVANTRDANGREIDLSSLSGQLLDEAPWFENALNERYLTGPNDFTGTVVSGPAYFRNLGAALGSASFDGLGFVFSAPIRNAAGEIVGVWANFADMSLVEQIIKQTHDRMRADGMGAAEVVVLNSAGALLVDYDPAKFVDGAHRRNMRELGQRNLREEGDLAAVLAADNDAGVIDGMHAERGYRQVAAWARSRGAYDFPGLGWSVLVRVPHDQVFAALNSTLNQIMMVVVGCALFLAVFGMALGRRIALPIRHLIENTVALADGRILEIAGTNRTDEIGDVARALLVFKEKLAETERLRAARDAAESSRQQRLGELYDLSDTFDKAVGSMLASVARETKQMEEAASAITDAAAGTHEQAARVASAAQRSAVDVGSVASATEELSATATEIARLVDHSSSVANEARSQAEQSSSRVAGLREGAEKIGSVIELISRIAAQTNLLALNATIEAARAGEAGKGFAVVANEVKSLANQTAQAAQSIVTQVASIQQASTEAADIIEKIAAVIGDVHQNATAIAASVSEQQSSTSEIARSVNQVSASAAEVTASIATVNESAETTDQAARNVAVAANVVSGEATRLNDQVSQFLAAIKRATDRRQFERHRVSGNATLLVGNAEHQSQLIDISLGGVLVRPGVTIAAGTIVQFVVADFEPLHARVVEGTEAGVRLQFLSEKNDSFVVGRTVRELIERERRREAA